jgi:homoserine kinase
VFVSDKTLSTESARVALPKRVTRSDAVFNVAHASLVVASILRADGALLGIAMRDRLHEPARRRLIPALDFIARAARSAGAYAAALSGAGPSVLAIAPTRLSHRVASAMEAVSAEENWPGHALVLRVRTAGAQVRKQAGN